jgi:hypothetical protein
MAVSDMTGVAINNNLQQQTSNEDDVESLQHLRWIWAVQAGCCVLRVEGLRLR